MRNGNRWCVYAIDANHNRIAARRLHDGARAAFTGEYLRGTSPTAMPSPSTLH